jgi:hypothetical protein
LRDNIHGTARIYFLAINLTQQANTFMRDKEEELVRACVFMYS